MAHAEGLRGSTQWHTHAHSKAYDADGTIPRPIGCVLYARRCGLLCLLSRSVFWGEPTHAESDNRGRLRKPANADAVAVWLVQEANNICASEADKVHNGRIEPLLTLGERWPWKGQSGDTVAVQCDYIYCAF